MPTLDELLEQTQSKDASPLDRLLTETQPAQTKTAPLLQRVQEAETRLQPAAATQIDQDTLSRPGVPIPTEAEGEMENLVKQLGAKGAFVSLRERQAGKAVKQTEAKEFAGFRSESADALARGIASTTAGGLDALERASESSVFPAGMFSEPAALLREISKEAGIQPAKLAKNASKRRKAGAFIANAVGETLPFMAASIGSTLATGTPLAAFATSFTIEGENARQDALDAGATDSEADMEAFVVGTINGALESLQVDEILKFSGVGRASKKAFIEAVRQRSIEKLAKAGGKLTLAAARTAVTEGIQEALQETTSILAPGLSGRDLPSPEEAFKRIGMAAVGGAVVGPILGGAVGGVTTSQDIDAEPTVGEADIVPPFEREQDGKLDKERDVQSRSRPGPIQEEQRVGPAEAENALEDQKQKEVASEQATAAAVKPVAAKPSGRTAVQQSAQRLANANKQPVFIKDGKIFKDKPDGESVTVKPFFRIKAGAVATEIKPITEPQLPEVKQEPRVAETPAVQLARKTALKNDPTAIVTAKTPEINKQVEQVVDVDFTTKKRLDLTSPRQADIAEDRKALGMDAINSKSRRGWNKAQKIAKKELIHRKADDIAKEILAEPVDNMGDVKTAGLTIRMAELKKEHKLATRNLKAAKTEADIATRAAERNRVFEKLDTIQKAIDLSGSQAGRTLAAQKLQINEDFDLESTLLNAVSAKKANLNKKESNKFEKLTESLDRLTTKIDAVFANTQLSKAKRFVRKGRGRAATEFKSLTAEQRQSEMAQRVTKTREMLKQGCNN